MSKEKLAELKQQWDGKPIVEIENRIHSAHTNCKKWQKTIAELLFYLEKTSRYRENKAYKDKFFEDYIQDQYGIKMPMYLNWRMVFIKFPVEAEEFGTGTVVEIIKKVGPDKVHTVCEHIRRGADKDSVIAEFTPKKKEQQKQEKQARTDVCRTCLSKDKRIKELEREIRELKAQNEKLKETVRKLRGLETGIRNLAPYFQQTEVRPQA